MWFPKSIALRAFLPALAFSLSVDAFWRMPCRSRSGLARIDPLVSFGSVAEHAHAIHGGSGFTNSATTAQLLASECTSCEVAQDKSAYWHPALYFKDAATGSFKLVEQVGGMLAYYLLFPNVGESTVTAFPENFVMISGDTNQRNYSYPVPDVEKSFWNVDPYNTQTFLRQAALGFNCLDYSKTPEASLYRHSMPDKAYLDANCKDGVRFELMFPSCWNGKDVTSPDKKSHVAFPSQVMTGDCPEGFPKRLPSLFYEIIWNTNAFAGTAGEFVIANGDTTGNGFHGDFITGWDANFLQSAVDQCTNPSGLISDCSLFTIQDASIYGTCNITLPTEIAEENLVGAIDALPGNVPVVGGPGYAYGAAPGQNEQPASNPAAVPSYKPATSEVVPGAIFAAKATAEEPAAGEPTPASVMSADIVAFSTPAPTPAPPSVPTPYSTEYRTEGNVVNEIVWVQEEVTVTASQTSTSITTVVETNYVAAPGRRKREYNHNHRRFGH